ncbi:alpha-D-ribose 1-methylphosphonate 5-triphosphate diphosphatase [Oricola thermophila]|uniref:Alpha-D-ribose 1-methylphosphonate 5-triphosphate diphosphatase n=1 Tax=Oricola thermophila TaxID=2742145 RepID=A0A6N1VEF3_9HYPH|nr:alpha-D-ribose 1-methylphosphonate 5-triphosphate diphosphatase [Oricola thermophila]QKV17539.1 alpha-D-ribose 1-methylphosphonate 5-triphosphate diphosphatase [Oricola thermophila]
MNEIRGALAFAVTQSEEIFTNARIVLADEVLDGTVVVRDGRIADIQPGGTAVPAHDLEGDYLTPGLVELHTDHLETHYSPRPGVVWNLMASVQAYDAQIATSGITTVFDCFRMGSDEDGGFQPGEMRKLADALKAAQTKGRLRAEHRIHLRCEVSSHNVLEELDQFRGEELVGLVSLMDHAPGQRQFQTMDKYVLYYQKKRGLNDDEFAEFVKRRQEESARYSDRHRAEIAEHCHAMGIAIASHDDATLDHVAEAIRLGVRLAEFPTTLEAAKASHEAGMSVLMGAPNIVRGGSHSGNIAAIDLARHGILDVLSSDYIPFSLLHSVFVIAHDVETITLPIAMRMVTKTPAEAVGLVDRGEIAIGKRADVVRVHHDPEHSDHVPVVRGVWRAGRRVA